MSNSSRSRKTIASLLARIQDATQTTRSELLFVTIILAGLSAGIVFKRYTYTPASSTQTNELTHIIDSLTLVEQSTFTGTTPDAEPVSLLATADTLRKKSIGFESRNSTKKEKITSGTIRLNTATIQDLMRLPGIGKATAEKIVQERAERKFTRIEDVMRVKGIGKKKFEAMKPFLSL